LSRAGIDRMKKAAKGIHRLDLRFDVVITSPLVRARQTAEIVAGAFRKHPPVTELGSLAPDGHQADLLADLRAHARRARIALVGHEPNLGELAAHLIGSRHPLHFRKGGVCRIDVATLPPSRPGTLQWFVTPAMLRAFGRQGD
jgi:phosphohistidine phosphatase